MKIKINHSPSMNSFNLANISLTLVSLPLKSSVVSITSTFLGSCSLNQFSCFQWINFKYSRGISSYSGLFLILVLSQHFSGVHFRYMIFVWLMFVMDSKLLYRDLNTSYSASSMYPKSFMSWENTYLSARMLLYEILILSGKRSQAY